MAGATHIRRFDIATPTAATQSYVYHGGGSVAFKAFAEGSAAFTLRVNQRVPGLTDDETIAGATGTIGGGGGQVLIEIDEQAKGIYVLAITGNTGSMTTVGVMEVG